MKSDALDKYLAKNMERLKKQYRLPEARIREIYAQEFYNTVMGSATEDETDSGFEVHDTPAAPMATTTSANPARPRTVSAGYDYNQNKLTVVFRDGTWWEYRGVSPEIWDGFKAATSKGKYLRESGLDNWGDMGPADVTNMPRNRRVMLNSSKALSDQLYGSQ